MLRKHVYHVIQTLPKGPPPPPVPSPCSPEDSGVCDAASEGPVDGAATTSLPVVHKSTSTAHAAADITAAVTAVVAPDDAPTVASTVSNEGHGAGLDGTQAVFEDNVEASASGFAIADFAAEVNVTVGVAGPEDMPSAIDAPVVAEESANQIPLVSAVPKVATDADSQVPSPCISSTASDGAAFHADVAAADTEADLVRTAATVPVASAAANYVAGDVVLGDAEATDNGEQKHTAYADADADISEDGYGLMSVCFHLAHLAAQTHSALTVSCMYTFCS